MTEILAVFRSRTQAADCNSRLRSACVNAALINTPKEANVGCGLSIKLRAQDMARAKFIIRNAGYSAFYGFFAVVNRYGRITLVRQP